MQLVLSLLNNKKRVLVPVTSVKLHLKVAKSVRYHAVHDTHVCEPVERLAPGCGSGVAERAGQL